MLYPMSMVKNNSREIIRSCYMILGMGSEVKDLRINHMKAPFHLMVPKKKKYW